MTKGDKKICLNKADSELYVICDVQNSGVNSTEEVRAALNEHSTGEQMNMEIERDGNTIEVMVSL